MVVAKRVVILLALLIVANGQALSAPISGPCSDSTRGAAERALGVFTLGAALTGVGAAAAAGVELVGFASISFECDSWFSAAQFPDPHYTDLYSVVPFDIGSNMPPSLLFDSEYKYASYLDGIRLGS